MPEKFLSKEILQTQVCKNCLIEKNLKSFKRFTKVDGSIGALKTCHSCYGRYYRYEKNRAKKLNPPYFDAEKNQWLKVCSKCKVAKLFNEYAKCRRSNGGLQSICKVCRKSLYYKKLPKVLLTYSDPKICETCKTAKPLKQFGKSYRRKGGGFTYTRNCHSCANAWTRRNQVKSRKVNLPYQINGDWFKTCSKCNSAKKLTEFNKNNKVVFGVNSVCKTCVGLVYYEKHPKPRLVFQDPQICEDCKVIKSLSKFQSRKHRDGTIGYDKKCAACRPRKYSKVHRDKRKQRLAANPELKRIANKKAVDAQLRRKARKLGASVIVSFTKADIIKRDGLCCYLCDKKLTEKEATMEHLIPLSRGGNHKPENIKIACRPCNSKKHTKTLSEYKKWRGDYTKFQLRRLSTPLLSSRLSHSQPTL